MWRAERGRLRGDSGEGQEHVGLGGQGSVLHLILGTTERRRKILSEEVI